MTVLDRVQRRRLLELTPSRTRFGLNQTMGRNGPTGPLVPTGSGLAVIGRQVTSSEGNHWPPKRRSGLQDIGSSFDTVRHEFHSAQADWYVADTTSTNPLTWSRYTGPLYTRPVTGSVGDFPAALEDVNLNGLGATAIARTIPTNPAADVATLIGELALEGLPSMLGAQLLAGRGNRARNASGEYLNYQFGIAPLTAELKALYRVLQEHEKLLKQLRRDSGKTVRRQYTFPIERTVTETSKMGTGVHPYPLTANHFSAPERHVLTTTVTQERETWFSGCYTYYLDPGSTTLAKIARVTQEMRYLLGLELTPEVIWNLTPWSWLVDWFSNVGDVIHNVSAFQQDGLVLRYGYIMQTSMHEVTYTLSGLTPKRSNMPTAMSDTYRTVRKRRLKAGPYGFSLDLSQLTPRQASILVALGISRGSKPR